MIRPSLVLLLGAVVSIASACGSTNNEARHRVVIGQRIVSPDHRSVVLERHVFVTQTGSTGYLDIGPVGASAKRTVYSSNDACCSNLVWATPRLIVFADDYRVKTVDVTTGRVRRIADFSNFSVSHDGRWVAGWANSGGHGPQTIAVVSITGTNCRVLPRPKPADDSDPRFSADGRRLSFMRRRYDPKLNEDTSSGHVLTVPVMNLRRTSARDGVC